MPWERAISGSPDAAFVSWACGRVKSSDTSGKAADKGATAAATEAILGHWQGMAQQFQDVVFDIDRRSIHFRGCKAIPYDMVRSSIEPLGRRITIEFKIPSVTSQCFVGQDDFITFFVNDDNTVDINLAFDRSRDGLDSRENESGGFFDHSGDRPFKFTLTKGHGLPVCEAYLQRLNNTPFDIIHRPYCDRPEDDSVPGFSKLVRVPLPPSEVNTLYKLAFNFELPPRQFEIDQLKSIRRGELNVTADVGVGLDVWRYDPPVDIFNNGKPANILMWHGVGQGGPIRRCGLDLGSGWGLRSDQMPIVFKPGDDEIDEQATKLLIAHPVQQYDSHLNTGNLGSSATDFRPIARSIGVFKYRDLYYFDGFFDIWGDATNERRGRPALANTLAVFLHKDGVSRQICEYQLSDGRDYPKP